VPDLTGTATLKDIAGIIGMHYRHIHRVSMTDPSFPKPITVLYGIKLYRISDVARHMQRPVPW
jgi:hypothetical protein